MIINGRILFGWSSSLNMHRIGFFKFYSESVNIFKDVIDPLGSYNRFPSLSDAQQQNLKSLSPMLA